jgi:DNA-binding PadR family transcriptional regulator
MVDRPRVDRFLPLKPKVFHILLALADGPSHGYAVMQEVRQRTEGKVRLWPTGLYGAIRELEKLGLIIESDRRPSLGDDDERRRYYEVTPLGRQVLDAEVARLQELLNHAAALRAPRKPKRA